MCDSITWRRSVLRTLAAFGLAALSSELALGVSAAPIRIETGLLRGVPADDPTITVYKGVPYAAPPTGALRWKAPQPPLPWAGVRKADQFGASCPQERSAQAALTMSEDCLFLNVWTGAASSSERRPVFVWIYGGGFIQGSSSNPEYNLTFIVDQSVKMGTPMIGVSLNYRLHCWGFLWSQEVRDQGVANLGFRDQRMALHWIQESTS